jgi:hypothetical protein
MHGPIALAYHFHSKGLKYVLDNSCIRAPDSQVNRAGTWLSLFFGKTGLRDKPGAL